MALGLARLGLLTAVLRKPTVLHEPSSGERHMFRIESGTLIGDRIRAELQGGSAVDWLLAGPDGTSRVDMRALMRTNDGATIFISCGSRVDPSVGRSLPLYSTPRFETADERYRWLYEIQAVGKGEMSGTTLRCELYERRSQSGGGDWYR